MERIIISSSSLDDFLYCPYKYKFNWIEGLTPKVKNLALIIGEGLHDGLLSGPQVAITNIMRKYPSLSFNVLVKIEAMILKAPEYLRMPEMKEQEYSYDLKNLPVTFRGRLDGIHADTIYEYKTSKSFKKPLQQIVSNDTQHRFYALLKRLSTGETPQYVCYGRILKTQIRPKKLKGGVQETKEEFKARVFKTYSSGKMFEQNTFNIYWMDRFEADLKNICKVFVSMIEQDSFYRSWNCRKEAQSDCDFMKICTQETNCMQYYFKREKDKELVYDVEDTENGQQDNAVCETDTPEVL